MNEELKFIVEHVNKLFGTNYNMMSFDSMSNTSLLQVLGDVLVKLEVAEKIDVNGNLNTAIVDILDALLTIKYTPSSDVSPITFREGIATGKRSIVYPILNWIFSNRERIKKIKYLATYVEKVIVPDEFKSDNDISRLYNQYEKLIDEFWNAYNENKKAEKQAAEAAELKRDIKKMENDTAKLKELVENQKEKVAAIPNNAALVVLAKDYHDAISERSNLEEQLKGQKLAIDNLEIDIKHLREQLQQKKSLNVNSEDPLKMLREEVHINKILAETKLPEELETYKRELELYTMVVNDPEPSQQEINNITEEIEKVSNEIKALQRKLAVNSNEDKLAPFRNQAKIIANKKNELSEAVMSLKQELESVEAKITEKRNTLQSILGGPAIYGDELRQYITSVRDRCNIYKELRTQEQALRSELGVLTRTFEILKAQDPNMEKVLEAKMESTGKENEPPLPADEIELQEQCKVLEREITIKRAEVMGKKERVTALNKEIDSCMKDYKTLKQEFEEATGAQSKRLETLQTEISLLESQIKEQEDKYKSLQQQIEKNENILQSLSEEMIDDSTVSKSRPKQIDIVKEKLATQKELNRKLKDQLKSIEDQKGLKETQMETLRIIKKFLKCKLEAS